MKDKNDDKEILKFLTLEKGYSSKDLFLIGNENEEAIFAQDKYGAYVMLSVDDGGDYYQDKYKAAVRCLKKIKIDWYKTDEEAEKYRLPVTYEDYLEKVNLEFYNMLGKESDTVLCKNQHCNRGKIDMSIYCRIHHYEMIKKEKCPFNHKE